MELTDATRLSVTEIQEPLEINTNLDTVVTNEEIFAKLQCSVNGPADKCLWYRNGQLIQQNSRIKIITVGKRYKLAISQVRPCDLGIYTVIIKHKTQHVISHAALYVGPALYEHNITGSYFTYPKQTNEVRKHLSYVKVKVGGNIRLKVEFQLETDRCVWYRNDKILEDNANINVDTYGKTSKLEIKNATVSDSGIYYVVNIGKNYISSSFAEVSVIDNDIPVDVVYPEILENLPEEIEATESEDITLLSRIATDMNSRVEWTRNGAPVDESRTILEDFGDQYLGLRVVKPVLSDKGQYAVTVRNTVTNHTVTSETYLSVEKYPMVDPPLIEVRKPLESTVAVVGTKVSFYCSFNLPDTRYFFVTWILGVCEIERTNSSFKVICNGGEFILHVRALEPDMAGRMTCELRRSLPQEKSVVVASTSAYLTLVPPCLMRPLQELPFLRYNELAYQKARIGGETGRFVTGNCSDLNGNGDLNTEEEDLVITYCRLEDEGVHFLHTSENNGNTLVEVTENEPNLPHEQKTVILRWRKAEPSWYDVYLSQASGQLVESGVTSEPEIVMKAPPLEKMLKFIVRASKPPENTAESSVTIDFITPCENSEEKPYGPRDILPLTELDNMYSKKGMLLGAGAFGSVVLVENKRNQLLAAKIVKMRKLRYEEMAKNEFEALCSLRHPNIVTLIDAFNSAGCMVLIMEYLWGGELFHRIVQENHFREADAIVYVKQILRALEYMNSKNYVHFDIKPENIMCKSPNSKVVKLVDFGLSKVISPSSSCRALYGTQNYMAPEVRAYEDLSHKCDMFSTGVVTHLMLSGKLPFNGLDPSEFEYNEKLLNQDFDFDTACPMMSVLARDFVSKLIIRNPTERMSASQALEHPWIALGPPRGMPPKDMKKARENLRTYLKNSRAQWQEEHYVSPSDWNTGIIPDDDDLQYY